LKIEKDVKEYVSYCIVESKDKRKLTMAQPHLLIDKFGEDIEGKRNISTPEHQDSKSRSQLKRWMYLTIIIKRNINLVVECCYI
jgi:hypothetical protein